MNDRPRNRPPHHQLALVRRFPVLPRAEERRARRAYPDAAERSSHPAALSSLQEVTATISTEAVDDEEERAGRCTTSNRTS